MDNGYCCCRFYIIIIGTVTIINDDNPPRNNEKKVLILFIPKRYDRNAPVYIPEIGKGRAMKSIKPINPYFSYN